MTIEQKLEAFKAEHPDAYKAIFDSGAKSNEQRPATIGELKAGFPADASFALECAEKALTATEAKAAYADVLSGRLEKQATEATAAATRAKAEHDAAAKAKDEQLAELQTKLDAMPRGNEAASFSAEGADPAKAKKVKDLTHAMGSENLAKFAAAITIPAGQAGNLPAAPKK